MLKIDRTLLQWSKNQNFALAPSTEQIVEVGFYNIKSVRSIDVQVIEGMIQVPDCLLKYSLPITAVCYSKKGQGLMAISRQTIGVKNMARPVDYTDNAEDSQYFLFDADIIYEGGREYAQAIENKI